MNTTNQPKAEPKLAEFREYLLDSARQAPAYHAAVLRSVVDLLDSYTTDYAASGDDPFTRVKLRRIANGYRGATRPDPRGDLDDLLDGLAAELRLDDFRTLRLAGEAAVAATPRAIKGARDRGMTPPRIADELGLTPSRVYQVLRELAGAEEAPPVVEYRLSTRNQDAPPARMAYDFGDALHVMDVDQHGAHDPATVEVLPMNGDRDDTLAAAGYRPAGEWTQHGDAEGVVVERDQ